MVKLGERLREPLVASLLLVARPGAPSSFLLVVVRPAAPRSVLAPCGDQSCPVRRDGVEKREAAPHGLV